MGKGYDLSDVKLESDNNYDNHRSSYTPKNQVDPSNGSVYGYNNNGYLADDEKSYKEKQPEEKEDSEKPQNVPITEMFRFAEGRDKMMLILGVFASIAHGAMQPIMVLIFGQMADTFIDDAKFGNWLEANWDNITMFYPNASMDAIKEDPSVVYDELIKYNRTDIIDEIESRVATDLLDQMKVYATYYCIIGACVVIFGYTHITCWQTVAYRQCQKIRSLLFRSILKQEISWFDTTDSGELNSRLNDDVNQVQEGIGDKLGMGLQYISTFFAGFLVGIIKGWKLTLVIISITPFLALVGGLMSRLGAIFTAKELAAYAKAGAIAEEVLGSMRTVVAFGGEKKEMDRYGKNLKDAKDKGIQRGLVAGAGMGSIFLLLFCTFALAFWYGSTLVWDGEYTGGAVLTVFFAVITASFSLGNALPNLQDFANSRGAAYTVYKIIDRVPEIDSSSSDGIKPEKVVGNVEFRDVVFSYPARKNVTVLNKLNLKVTIGQTVALVGSSGCGKSTTVQLLQRFYDPDQGQILVDGIPLVDYNIKYLRQHIGVVSQEPVLFDNTIAENIRFGRDGVKDAEIQSACRKANAHDFIMRLPKGYDTLVGERGTQLSGGQKQRIAIARALVRDPKILLLDEATSALDTESEASVQAALDRAREGRTTIVIAHRLSTIKNADVIAGFENGRVKEQGSHEELMELNGIYATLVNNQKMQDDEGHLDLGMGQKHLLQQQMSVVSTKSDIIPYHKPSKRTRTVSSSSTVSRKGRTMSFMEEEEELEEGSMKRIFQLNSPEWYFILIGVFACFIAGGIQPAFAVMISNMLGVYSDLDEEAQREQVTTYVFIMIGIGLAAGSAMFTFNVMFGFSGERLTERLRNMTFRCLMGQEIAYFDDHKNSTGALTTRLSTDASAVKGATGIRLGTLVRSMSCVGVGLGIGFYYSWKLSLVILAFAPFMAMAGFIQVLIFSGKRNEYRSSLEKAGKIATEAIENMRTVAGLTKEDAFHTDYTNLTYKPIKKNMKQAQVLGLGYGLSQGCIFFAYAASYTFGAQLVKNEELKYDDLYKVIISIAMGALAVGQANSFAPDYGKAKQSAARLFELFDRIPAIDSFSESGAKPDVVKGTISVENVAFHYPSRPDVAVLRGLNLTVEPGQTVALVGSSGCGKSTTIQLLERFYDPAGGQVLLDERDTTSVNIRWLRQQMGLVSQEPTLFDASIRDNIAYGDNSREIPMNEIIEAAKNANIHKFIQSLPQGYDTNVGDKGTQLSGGQKQRVAIARALVRDPKILLLDEATSALDTESEKIVQEALDQAQEGRTCITIAHRLSTIQNADRIFVIDNGMVAESGTHNELLALKGIYFNLNMVQMRNTKR